MNVYPIVKKEFRQIRRDTRALGILIFIPAFLLVMVGYALDFDVKNLFVGVYDEDKSQTSREFIASLTHSEYLTLTRTLGSQEEVSRALEREQIQIALIIPPDFSRKLLSGKLATVQVVLDGSNSNTANIAQGYLTLGVQEYSRRVGFAWLEKRGEAQVIPLSIEPRLWYNPELQSAQFLIPGLFGLILMIVTVVSTSLSIVREKETGTMEQLMTSPLPARAIIIGKAIPYLIIALIAATMILILGWMLFDVAVRGSIIQLYFGIILFLLAGLGQGLLISSIAQSQQVAYLMSVFSSLLPSFLLSGFVFPIESMPVALQVLSNVMAPKFFIVIIRAIMLKGVGLEAVWENVVSLAVFTGIVLSVSSIRLRKEMTP
jgi:ABC-2 type transport system permease protein